MSYALCGLITCDRLPSRPAFIPRARCRGVRAAGLSYERKVGKVLRVLFPAVHSGEWFRYLDERRDGVCQVDHYVRCRSHIILVECKLAENDEAWTQMSLLYAPILEQHYGLPVARVQACKIMRSRRKVIDHPAQALPGRESLWHVLA